MIDRVYGHDGEQPPPARGGRNQMNDEPFIKIPIEGILDLHTFHPRDLPSLLTEYLTACREDKIYSVRIIHGKGTGLQKHRVRGLLNKNPIVESYSDAGHDEGGWGATIVKLKRDIDFTSPAWVRCLEFGAKAMGASLTGSQIARFAIHATELMAWNQTVNLTAITDPTELAVKQFLDTLPLAPLSPETSRVLDIGSGGGFPGIPLKILRPDLHVTLIDGVRKKVSFQKHVIGTLGLKDIEAHHIRAEELGRQRDLEAKLFNVIVSKALSKIDRFLEIGIPLLRRPGMIIAMKGGSVEAELEAAQQRIEAEGLSVNVRRYRLPCLDIERCLVVMNDAGGNQT
jgi:16S rRNA (guanine527-N7)-methyltransferase